MYRLICQKLAHFLSAQMALVSTFFKYLMKGEICRPFKCSICQLRLATKKKVINIETVHDRKKALLLFKMWKRVFNKTKSD